METVRSTLARKMGMVLFGIAVLATLLGLFHLVENWRGKKKWEAYKREAIARGAKLDLAQLVPPPIPDEQNFAATPFFAQLFPKPKTNANPRWPDTFAKLGLRAGGGSQGRQLTDFVEWEAALRSASGEGTNAVSGDRTKAAAEMLKVLKPYEPALEELRAASARPLARYPIRYDLENPWGILLPHLAVLKSVSQVLSAKACAELATGDTEQAMEDVRLTMRLVDSMKDELFLINYLVRIACLQLAVQPVWEGLALGKWSDAHLEELQRLLLPLNFVEDLQKPLQAERAAGVMTPEMLLKQPYKADFLNAFTGSPTKQGGMKMSVGNMVALLIPRGWYHLEQYEMARLYEQFLFPGSDGTNRVVDPNTIASNQAQLVRAITPGWKAILRHRFLSGLLVPALGRTQVKAAQAQTVAHQAAIACALERYRHKHGDYPAELAKLAPEFMERVPRDVIGGQPLGYKAGKSFMLYSVGWDGKDNGGTPGKVLWDDRGGDWVWSYPN